MAIPNSQKYPEKLCLNKSELDINVYNFEIVFFKFGFLYKSDLCISTAENINKLLKLNTYWLLIR